MTGTALVTLNRGRRPHLRRLLEGLARGPAPDLCVVVDMGDDEGPLPETPFPIRRVVLGRDGLPLAAARNAGRAAAAGCDTLVFLDVDCIPAAELVPAMAAALAERDALVCCPVRYLPAGAVRDGWREEELAAAGVPHPARRFPASGFAEVENPGLFWSLAFGIRAATFDCVGGFDEGFAGYGAEDTDFAFRAREAGVTLLFVGGPGAYHQHHGGHDPPLQHFADIVRNARRFRARHGLWPMEGWLDAFAARGLIDPDRSRDIAILREPDAGDLAAARLPEDQAF